MQLAARRRRTIVVALIGVVVGGLVTVLLVAGGSGSPPSSPAILPTSPTALPQVDAAGLRTILAAQRGRVVVVNLWASWCGPCIKEAPGLAALGRRYQGRVQFIGVDTQDTRSAARPFIRKYGWTYPSLFDPDGSLERELGFIGQPVTVVYGADGARAKTFSGAVETTVLDAAIRGALAGGAGP